MTISRRGLMAGVLLHRLQRAATSDTFVLGVNLRPAAVGLLRDIERVCGKELQALRHTLQYNRAEGGISEDGIPRVWVDPSVEPTEELIVHELYHMKLTIDGFPKLDLLGHSDWHLWLRSDILDVVQHRIFYPKLRALGFTPEAQRIREVRNLIVAGAYPSDLHPVEIASRYFRVKMETNTVSVVSEMAQWYRTRGWIQALELGDEAYSCVRDRQLWRPQDEVQACIDCANIFLKRLYRLKFERWDGEWHGSILQRYAVISINSVVGAGTRSQDP